MILDDYIYNRRYSEHDDGLWSKFNIGDIVITNHNKEGVVYNLNNPFVRVLHNDGYINGYIRGYYERHLKLKQSCYSIEINKLFDNLIDDL